MIVSWAVMSADLVKMFVSLASLEKPSCWNHCSVHLQMRQIDPTNAASSHQRPKAFSLWHEAY